MISYGVINHEIEPDWSVPEEYCRLEDRYLFLQMFWAEQILDK